MTNTVSCQLTLNNVNYSCTANPSVETTVEQINVQLYNVLQNYGITREYFMNNYVLDATSATRGSIVSQNYSNIGVVSEVKDDATGETQTTHKIIWTFNNSELWDNAGKTIYHFIKYNNTANGSSLIVRLTTTIGDVKKVYDIVEAKYIGEYWNADKSIAYFNVDVPTSTSDANDANCLFENDTNSPFVTYEANDAQGRDGILKVDDYVTSIAYYFHAKNNGSRTIGGKSYTFTRKNNNTELWCTSVTPNELIAHIDNSGTYTNTTNKQLPNAIVLNKASDIAKELLNTDEFQVYIMATGYVCGATAQSVEITFKGEEYYVAQYVKPINFLKEADKEFIDGVDFGEVGSYLNIKNIVRPIDWRNRQFSSYPNYWGYYGPFQVTFTNTVETAKIKLNLPSM